MNLFQWVTVPVLIMIAVFDFRFLLRDRRPIRFVRIIVWFLAALMILNPQSASFVAKSVGIGRGTDLVIYAFMLTTTAILFHLYGGQFTMRRDLVELARREALRTPIAGAGLDTTSNPNELISNREPSA